MTQTQAVPPRMPADAEPGPPSVLAVVVTHNGRAWLRESLVALANQSYPLLDVLVVDDASTDHRRQPSLKRIAKRHLRRRRWGYLRTPRPLGFGAAANWALSRVRTDADLLLFLHDDAVIGRDSVERMVERMTLEPETAVVGPKVVNWDDPQILEEVGMAADRFGYPYKGLDQGEIDLGQHDRASEVFYVTSTCMLVRHGVFRQLRGWDAQMKAFSEDLDLCWRARIAGHGVRFEPAAVARHAMGLATGQRDSPFRPARYFIRRNRLRSVAKNASTLRLIALIPQYLLLTIAEMIAFAVLRQPAEILSLARALGWNVVHLPQTLTERARVQRRRKVPDHKLRRLSVRESTRLRAYIENQAQRLEEAWGRRAELVAHRGAQARYFGARLAGWPGMVALLVLVVITIGFRNVLWSAPTTAGEILPYPDGATTMWRALIDAWNPAGLGHPPPHPPAFGILGIVPLLTFGAAAAAQKLLMILLGVVAFAGAYSLVAELVDRPGRVASGLAYAFGAVGYAGLREARLGSLVFAAAAPFVLTSMIRLAGWARPPGWEPGRAVARVALGGAVSAAFVPGSLLLYASVAVLVTLSRRLLDRGERASGGLVPTLIGLAFAWGLLLPWSATLFGGGGIFGRLIGDDTWQIFASSFRGHGMLSVLLGQTPDGPPLFGLALPLLGLVAVLVGEGARRRMALALWGVVVLTGLLVSLFAGGFLRPLVASPTEAGVPASLAFAGLAGLAIGAFRLDLRRRALGWQHAATIGALGVSAFLVVAGLGPATIRGGWDPGLTSGGVDAPVVEQVSALLNAEAQQLGEFRALWVGESWLPDDASALRPIAEHFITGEQSHQLTDLFDPGSGPGEGRLHRVIASIEGGATDRGGRLLGAFNVHFVVVERSPEADAWLAQQDLALIRTEPTYYVLRNERELPRAGIFPEVPVAVRALDRGAEVLSDAGEEPAEKTLRARDEGRAFTGRADGPGVVFLAENGDAGWQATVDERSLARIENGWGNAFALPEGTSTVRLHYESSMVRHVWTALLVFAWIVAIGIGIPRRTRLNRR
jgi:GT2 family glycosyltransferase